MGCGDPPATDPRGGKLPIGGHAQALRGQFSHEDRGKTAHYMLNWISATSEKGESTLDAPVRVRSAETMLGPAWSETASATIGG
jgi:hypothetical protein